MYSHTYKDVLYSNVYNNEHIELIEMNGTCKCTCTQLDIIIIYFIYYEFYYYCMENYNYKALFLALLCVVSSI